MGYVFGYTAVTKHKMLDLTASFPRSHHGLRYRLYLYNSNASVSLAGVGVASALVKSDQLRHSTLATAGRALLFSGLLAPSSLDKTLFLLATSLKTLGEF